MSRNNTANKLTTAGIVAAAYTVLTLISAVFGLSSGIIQIRISEALCVLPLFSAYAIPGLAVGCFLSNLLCGGGILDAIFGTAATLIGAILAYYIGKTVKNKLLQKIFIPLPNVMANTLIIPWVLRFVYGEAGAIWYFTVTVFAGEFIGSYILGLPLMSLLEKHKNSIFK